MVNNLEIVKDRFVMDRPVAGDSLGDFRDWYKKTYGRYPTKYQISVWVSFIRKTFFEYTSEFHQSGQPVNESPGILVKPERHEKPHLEIGFIRRN